MFLLWSKIVENLLRRFSYNLLSNQEKGHFQCLKENAEFPKRVNPEDLR
jgi:hypothetical protein